MSATRRLRGRTAWQHHPSAAAGGLLAVSSDRRGGARVGDDAQCTSPTAVFIAASGEALDSHPFFVRTLNKTNYTFFRSILETVHVVWK